MPSHAQVTFSYAQVTFSYAQVTFSYAQVTFSYAKSYKMKRSHAKLNGIYGT
jgi:hypothetical protein